MRLRREFREILGLTVSEVRESGPYRVVYFTDGSYHVQDTRGPDLFWEREFLEDHVRVELNLATQEELNAEHVKEEDRNDRRLSHLEHCLARLILDHGSGWVEQLCLKAKESAELQVKRIAEADTRREAHRKRIEILFQEAVKKNRGVTNEQ